MSVHVAMWTTGLFLALSIRFDGATPREYLVVAARLLALLLLVRAVTFWRHGLFHGILRYAGVAELFSIVRATTIGSVGIGLGGLFIHRLALPRSVYVIEWLIAIVVAGGLRFAVRLATDRGVLRVRLAVDAPAAILIGAGNAGELFLRDLQRSSAPAMRIAGILDDDPSKHGLLLHGVRVEGAINRDQIRRCVELSKATRVIMAIPTASGVRTREILEWCRALDVPLKTLPSVQQIADGNVRVSQLRDVVIEDLLRREPVTLDSSRISHVLAGRRVLITGAAGSIGSELVRQIARFKPAQIVLFDHSENGLFFLERELRELFPDVAFRVMLGSIRESIRVRQVFDETRPHVVYHAAAHKHVPLMEENPGEAVRNNVLGTRIVADQAGEHGCDAFVMISTDKAVNPTSVMGTTKRVAEMYVQSLAAKFKTRFVAVRFGNVLGSAGSVVPIFRQQIEAGGPVCVTHPEMRRYFMTIPEASQLVLQASALGRGGEIFILEMGELVRIVDLARDLISLSGLRPDIDIPIEFTGTRPGEKLYEELLLDEEAADATSHPKIRVAKIASQEHSLMRAALDRLDRLTLQVTDTATLRAELAMLVPESLRLPAARPSSVGHEPPPSVSTLVAAPLARLTSGKPSHA